jgi:hypothetical protein
MQTLIINNIDVLQKANINNQNDINQQILIFKDYIKNQVFIPKSSLNSRVYNNQLGYQVVQDNQLYTYLPVPISTITCPYGFDPATKCTTCLDGHSG